jgi:hypothetical protein
MSDDDLFYIGPDGTPIKLDDLPPRGFKDWQPRHKAIVVDAVRHGLITVDQASARYDLYRLNNTYVGISAIRSSRPQTPRD